MKELDDVLNFRRDLYAFLYRMYLEEPPRELASDLIKGEFFFPDIESLNKEISEGFEMIKSYASGKDEDDIYEDLVDEFTLLFIGPYNLPVQPYETIWVDGKMGGESLLTLKEDYRKAGVSRSKSYPEPEDHIAFELMFMHHLCEVGLSSKDDEGKLVGTLKTQTDFLEDHIMKWVPLFCDKLIAYEKADFYKCIAKITKGFLDIDTEVLKELLE